MNHHVHSKEAIAGAPRGYLMLLALVFGSLFLTVLAALSSYVLSENKLQVASTAGSRGLAIAEAGLEYYRWFLAHNPGNLTNGTGRAGPYTMDYNDPEGGKTGTISLSITGNTSCGQITSIDIASTGTPQEDATQARTIYARYAQPSVAAYSYIVNESVWAGADRVISGPYHSNGGVHMDGTSNSPVTSSLTSWSCDSNYGCSPTQSRADGVMGSGGDKNLWSFPTPQVDFAAISANFSNLKTVATASGLYFPRYSSGSSSNNNYWRGYHLIFNANGTVTVKKVDTTTSLTFTAINPADTVDRTLIASESLLGTYTIPASCGLIYVEDNIWVEGTIPSKVTLVSANVTTTGIDTNAVLTNNIQYAATDGTDGLTLIAEHNVLVAPNAPTNMTLNGVFIAQNGAFGRNLYWNNGGSACHSSYEPRGTLTILGTTVSNLRTGTRWTGVSGCGGNGVNSAGYQSRIDAYDRRLATNPPAFTPYTSSDYKFVDWREQ